VGSTVPMTVTLRTASQARGRPRSRATADGSWVAGPERELTPEQNAEATKACAETRDEGREVQNGHCLHTQGG